MSPIGRKSHKAHTPEYVTANHPGTTGPPAMAGAMPHQSNLPGPAPHTAGPHRHDILNKLDPTVDSRSGGVQILGPGVHPSANPQPQGYTHGQTANVGQPIQHGGVPPSSMQAGMGMGNGYGQPRHNSRLANAIDPRVDTTTTHAQGHAFPAGSQAPPMMASGHPGTAPQAAYGTHSSGMANTMDPRFDHDVDGRAQMGAHGQSHFTRPGEMIHPGPAPNTAGPHRSDIMNKLDPTVHSKDVVEPRQYRTG